ncbi:MAG TPA: NUDIX domain-containing protein [Acidimicrobiales bacterium]|nr:NUDIX domain-containing protein [Acidimicrobiales bacterium]
MGPWPPSCYQRATAFVTDPSHRLLVFDHKDSPGSDTQVPAGGIRVGEPHEVAVQRELAEESGITSARIVRKLGESWYRAEHGHVPAGLEEQVHHAFHLYLGSTPDETWEWDEYSDGDVPLHRFVFRWVDLDSATRVLDPSQGMWIAALRISLDTP